MLQNVNGTTNATSPNTTTVMQRNMLQPYVNAAVNLAEEATITTPTTLHAAVPTTTPITTPLTATANNTSPTAETTTTIPTAPAAPPKDIIGTIISDFGIWQLRTILILFLCKIPASWFMACIIFTAPALNPRTEFECNDNDLNATQTISADQCYIIDEVTDDNDTVTLERQQCTDFIYNADFQSLIMEFNLVCLRDIFVAWTQYWHLFGVLLGGVIGTKMMLRISPRTTYVIGMVVQIFCGVVTGYARDLTVHCAFRCISAIGCAIMFTSGQAIFVDITAGIHRTAAIILYDTFWSIGVIFLPTVSSLFSNWSHLYLGITFPTLLLMLLLQWTPESPRWLLKNGDPRDIQRVEATIREAAAINDRTFTIPDDFRQQLESLRETLKAQPAPASWLQLWRGPRAKTHMLAVHIALAAFITDYMGMLLNLRSFGRDYLVPNTIAMGFSELIGCFLALHFTLKRNKWKYQLAGSFNIIAGCIGCLGWTFTGDETMSPSLKVTLWMIIAAIPKMAVSCAQSMMLGSMTEIMPLNKRAPFAFSAVTWARMWLLSAPFINVFKKIDVALSLTVLSGISLLGGICTCLILTPRVSTPQAINTVVQNAQSNKKEQQSPLGDAVWTIEEDVSNTHL